MEPLEDGHYYHIYNRGAGKSNLFLSPEDYHLFLKLFFYYLFPCIKTYAWCLMQNHFHALIKVKTLEEQIYTYQQIKSDGLHDNFHGSLHPENKPYKVSKQLSHLFNSYTKKLNGRLGRTGTLIEGQLQRKRILDENHFNHMVCYIHRNPIHHKITNKYSTYPYSSYRELTELHQTLLEKDEVISSFGGNLNFMEAHIQFKYKIEWKRDYYME